MTMTTVMSGAEAVPESRISWPSGISSLLTMPSLTQTSTVIWGSPLMLLSRSLGTGWPTRSAIIGATSLTTALTGTTARRWSPASSEPSSVTVTWSRMLCWILSATACTFASSGALLDLAAVLSASFRSLPKAEPGPVAMRSGTPRLKSTRARPSGPSDEPKSRKPPRMLSISGRASEVSPWVRITESGAATMSRTVLLLTATVHCWVSVVLSHASRSLTPSIML